MYNVHFTNKLSPTQEEALLALTAGRAAITQGKEPPSPAEYDMLVEGSPTRELLEASPRLAAVVVPWAGVPPETRELLTGYPQITLHNLHHNAAATGETAVALLLAAAKRIVPMDQALRRGDWSGRFTDAVVGTLVGKRALILGYGQIGRHIGKVCQALGMEVVGVRRTGDEGVRQEGATVYTMRSLHDLLPSADVLIGVLPETPETAGVIGAAELARLPERAILINVGRGPTIDEQALYEALAARRLLAAGLDVWYVYPESREAEAHTMPAHLPFHELDNVVLSPHRAGYLGENDGERAAALAELINAGADGRPIPNEVSKELGY